MYMCSSSCTRRQRPPPGAPPWLNRGVDTYICLYSYICMYIYILARSTSPSLDQFPLRVCACPLCIINRLCMCVCVCVVPAARAANGRRPARRLVAVNQSKILTAHRAIYMYVCKDSAAPAHAHTGKRRHTRAPACHTRASRSRSQHCHKGQQPLRSG